MNVYSYPEEQFLGSKVIQSIEAQDGNVEIAIPFDVSTLALFKERVATGDIRFVFSYTYGNRKKQYGKLISSVSWDLSQALEEAVASEGLTDGIIFQDQAFKLRSTIIQKVKVTITASSADLIPVLQSQLVDKWMPSKTIDITELKDQEIDEAIYAYLRAQGQRCHSGSWH